jgi:hypothetical protein
MPYTVTRSSPDRDLVQTFDTKRQAFTSVGYSIVDNGHGTKAEAQRFAAAMTIGEPAEFPPFVFTITKGKP